MGEDVTAMSGEGHEHLTNSQGTLDFFEELGDEMHKRWVTNIPFDTRFHNLDPNLIDTFNLTTGEEAELSFIVGPKLSRQRVDKGKGLPEMWLPSGNLNITRIEQDGREITEQYFFGRSLAHNPYEPILRLDTFERKPHKAQIPIDAELLFTNNDGKITRLKKALEEIKGQLSSNPSRTPTPRQ